jgi:4-hydroxybenzoate polyprenyltransferase
MANAGAVPAVARPPRSTTAGRLAEHLGLMFPPAVQVPLAAAWSAGIWLSLQALEGRAPLRLSWRWAAAAGSFFLFALLMRAYDELKDVETDLRLGRAGDPNYKDRPIVTGRVRETDLRALRWAATAVLVGINLPLGPLPLLTFAITFSVAWLSFKWFFWPAISKNILLALVTHNPITALVALHVVAIYASEAAGLRAPPAAVAALVVGLWMPITAWETSRKIRPPEDETDYETYSRKLGWRVAPFLPASFVALGAACIGWVARLSGLSWIFPAVLTLAAAVAIGACMRFRLRPTRESAKLKPYVEGFALIVNFGLPLALWLRYGVTAG